MGDSVFGVKPSEWLPEWAADNGHDIDTVTTTNNVALERGLTGSKIRDLKEQYPDSFPQPINREPRNRQAFFVADWDTFFDGLAQQGRVLGRHPERLTPAPGPDPEPEPAPAADVPAPRRAPIDPHSKAGRLLAANARDREHLLRRIGELNLAQAAIRDHVSLILDIDQGTGQSAREARRAEITATEERIEALKQVLRELRNADRKANAYTEEDLPRLRAQLEEMREDVDLLRTVVWGERAQITRRYRQIVALYGEVDEAELPQIKETSETDRLLRELAEGNLVTIAGAATRLRVKAQQLRDRRGRWPDFPEAVGVHPNGQSGELYVFRQIEQAAKNHNFVYVDDEVPAL